MAQAHACAVQVLTPLQEARCLVEAQPWLPDMLALTGELAAEVGERQLAAQASEDYLTSHAFDLKQEPAFSAILAPTAGTPPGRHPCLLLTCCAANTACEGFSKDYCEPVTAAKGNQHLLLMFVQQKVLSLSGVS